jgi:uncharacterized protein (DUF58 family)
MSRALASVALGATLVLAAATFDTPSLYVPGLALVVLAVGAVTWVALAARGAAVVRGAAPPTVVEDEPYPLRLEIRSGVLPPPSGELIEPLLGWPVPLAGRWSRRVRINVRFSRRGRRVLHPATLVIRDPLGLQAREVRGAAGGELLVLPRIEPVLAPGGGAAGRGLAAGEAALAGARLHGASEEVEIDGLRPYRLGSPASRIHWPAVARRGEMLERRLISGADAAPLVVLDPTRPVSEEALDRAVRAAASLCLHLARAGGCGVLLPGERRRIELGPGLGAWPHVHARLAVVEAGHGAPRLARPPGGTVIWVSARPLRDPPTALRRHPGAAVHVVTPEPLPGARVAFTVAGCYGQRLRAVARRRAAA